MSQKNLSKAGVVEIFLTSDFITMQKFVYCFSHRVRSYRIEGVADRYIFLDARIPRVLHIPNLVALRQTVWTSVGGRKNWGTLGHAPLKMGKMGHVWLPETHSSHHKFDCSRSDCLCVITEILWKGLTLHTPPFKVTQGRWNWHGSIIYLWLPNRVL